MGEDSPQGSAVALRQGQHACIVREERRGRDRFRSSRLQESHFHATDWRQSGFPATRADAGPAAAETRAQTTTSEGPCRRVTPAWAKLARSAAVALPSGLPMPAAAAAPSANSSTATR